MNRQSLFVSVLLCCLLLSLGWVSGAGVVGSAGATGRTAMLGPGPHRDSQPSFLRAPSPGPPNGLDHSAGEG